MSEYYCVTSLDTAFGIVTMVQASK